MISALGIIIPAIIIFGGVVFLDQSIHQYDEDKCWFGGSRIEREIKREKEKEREKTKELKRIKELERIKERIREKEREIERIKKNEDKIISNNSEISQIQGNNN